MSNTIKEVGNKIVVLLERVVENLEGLRSGGVPSHFQIPLRIRVPTGQSVDQTFDFPSPAEWVLILMYPYTGRITLYNENDDVILDSSGWSWYVAHLPSFVRLRVVIAAPTADRNVVIWVSTRPLAMTAG